MRAIVHAEDRAVRGLLQDVLAEIGFETGPGGGRDGEPPALVVAHVPRGSTPKAVCSMARAGTRPAPVILVLPVKDEAMAQDALQVGADGCYALGTPLAALSEVIHSLVRIDGR